MGNILDDAFVVTYNCSSSLHQYRCYNDEPCSLLTWFFHKYYALNRKTLSCSIVTISMYIFMYTLILDLFPSFLYFLSYCNMWRKVTTPNICPNKSDSMYQGYNRIGWKMVQQISRLRTHGVSLTQFQKIWRDEWKVLPNIYNTHKLLSSIISCSAMGNDSL